MNPRQYIILDIGDSERESKFGGDSYDPQASRYFWVYEGNDGDSFDEAMAYLKRAGFVSKRGYRLTSTGARQYMRYDNERENPAPTALDGSAFRDFDEFEAKVHFLPGGDLEFSDTRGGIHSFKLVATATNKYGVFRIFEVRHRGRVVTYIISVPTVGKIEGYLTVPRSPRPAKKYLDVAIKHIESDELSLPGGAAGQAIVEMLSAQRRDRRKRRAGRNPISSLEAEARKEHEEHPWTTMAQARRIARDHRAKARKKKKKAEVNPRAKAALRQVLKI